MKRSLSRGLLKRGFWEVDRDVVPENEVAILRGSGGGGGDYDPYLHFDVKGYFCNKTVFCHKLDLNM